jgi:hypothetical protein
LHNDLDFAWPLWEYLNATVLSPDEVVSGRWKVPVIWTAAVPLLAMAGELKQEVITISGHFRER